MPIVSPKQFGLMHAAKASKLKSLGPSPKVAEEFLSATPKPTKSKFANVLAKKKNNIKNIVGKV